MITDEKLSDMIENADGMRCVDGEYRIEGRDLMNLARAIEAACGTGDADGARYRHLRGKATSRFGRQPTDDEFDQMIDAEIAKA